MREFPEGAAPPEIVAALHAEIARLDPDRAALVAAFDALPRRPSAPIRASRPPAATEPHRARMKVYTALRLGGAGKKAAARMAGITHHTGRRYESDLIDTLGGVL